MDFTVHWKINSTPLDIPLFSSFLYPTKVFSKEERRIQRPSFTGPNRNLNSNSWTFSEDVVSAVSLCSAAHPTAEESLIRNAFWTKIIRLVSFFYFQPNPRLIKYKLKCQEDHVTKAKTIFCWTFLNHAHQAYKTTHEMGLYTLTLFLFLFEQWMSLNVFGWVWMSLNGFEWVWMSLNEYEGVCTLWHCFLFLLSNEWGRPVHYLPHVATYKP